MKKIITGFLFILVGFCSATAQGKTEKAVAYAVEKLRKAMIDADKSLLESMVSANLSYGHSSGAVDDKALFVEKIVSGTSDFVSIELAEQSISVSGRTAVVRHILKAKTNDDGKPGEVQLRVLLVWQKQAGRWKLLARQAVKMS